jgi:hypothetical protein
MTVDSLAGARGSRLEQHLLACPACSGWATAHVMPGASDASSVVRFVCVNGCAVDLAGVLPLLPAGTDVLSA